MGAGRGPLVRAALRAADNAERRIRVFAVEKNPNAVITYVSNLSPLTSPITTHPHTHEEADPCTHSDMQHILLLLRAADDLVLPLQRRF